MYSTIRRLRDDLVTVCNRLWQKGYIAATDGNVSVKIDRNRILTTPSGVGKGFLKPEDLIITDLSGVKIEGNYEPTTEILMHLAAYEERPDIVSVVHAHPPRAIAFTIAGEELPAEVLPEVVVNLKRIPIVPYATPGTSQAGDIIRPYIKEYDAIMMDRHGSVTVGKDLFDAYYKLEKMEHAAEVIMAARQLGLVQTLSQNQLQELLSHHQNYSTKTTTTLPPIRGKVFKSRFGD